jgi:hypothetical protein
MLRGTPTVLLLIAMTLECACDRPNPQTYGSVRSPSGSMTAIKQEKGAEEISWDVFLIEHVPGHDRKIPLLSDQPLRRQVYGNDGVVMAWEDDHHLTLGWPNVLKAVSGPSRIDDVAVTYRPFEPDPDRVEGAPSEIVPTENAQVLFREVDGTTGGTYTATGKPVPHIQCIVDVSASDPTRSTTIGVELIWDGIGQPNDPYPTYGGLKLRFRLAARDASVVDGSMLTQAKWGSRLPKNPWDFDMRQLDGSLLYGHYSIEDVRAFSEDIQAKILTLKYVFGFDRRVRSYRIGLSTDDDINPVFKQFNDCLAKTNTLPGLQLPIR